ncbi:MAG: FUSC family protein, partial [Turicibacter sp.]
MSNTMVAVSIVVIALTLVTIDLKENIIRKTFLISMVLVTLGIGASIASVNVIFGFIVNAVIIFAIVHQTLDTYKTPLYFPFILSYIFMLMSSPANYEALPFRVVSIVVGSIYVLLVQLVLNKDRFTKTMVGTRRAMIYNLTRQISNLQAETTDHKLTLEMDNLVNTSVKAIYDNREKNKYLTQKNKGYLELTLSLQDIHTLLIKFKSKQDLSEADQVVLINLAAILTKLDAYFNHPTETKRLDLEVHRCKEISKIIDQLTHALWLSEQDTDKLSWKKDWISKNAFKKINIDSLAFKFAIKFSLSVSLMIFLVTIFEVPYGRWIIFPMLGIIQPYYDFASMKARNRIIGTLLGIVLFTVIFAIVEDNTIRMNITILAAYFGLFMTQYQYSTSMVAISALGASAMSGGGIEILFYRLGFTLVGCAIAMLINKYVLQCREEDAINELARDYNDHLNELKRIKQKQKYETKRYNLVLNMKLMEYKINLHNETKR